MFSCISSYHRKRQWDQPEVVARAAQRRAQQQRTGKERAERVRGARDEHQQRRNRKLLPLLIYVPHPHLTPLTRTNIKET